MVLLFKELSTVILNAGLAWMTGTFFARIWLGNCSASWCDKARRRLHFSVLAAAGMCIIGSVCALWAEMAIMNDSSLWDARGVLWTMLTMTHYGRAGLYGLVVLPGLACVYLARNRLQQYRGYDGLIATLLLVFAYARVSVSHAAIDGMFGLNVWVQWLHLLLISLWAGAVMVAAWSVLPCAKVFQKTASRATTVFLKALSRAATLALAGIVATGAYNAVRGLGSFDNFSASAYGHALAIKLCLVAVAVGLGAFNRFIGFPAVVMSNASDSSNLQAIPWPAAMQRVVFVLRLESLVLLAVLIAAAVLTNQAPPALS
ncbi:MAG: CopD family protein [Oxalobacteraceae bacterium]